MADLGAGADAATGAKAEPAVAPALAIIAGRDALPRLIAEDRARRGMPYLVIAFAGAVAPWIAFHPHEVHRFEKPGRLFRALRRAKVREVVFAGAMDRPRLALWRADLVAMRIAPRVFRLLRSGDDSLLSGLGAIFETEGFRLIGAEDCLPGLTAAEGVLGRHAPGQEARADAARGAAILAALGPLDVTQAVAVARGVCLGIEAIEGTDALLSRIAALPPAKRGPTPSGVLVKLPKPGQDRRVDLPTIGPGTVSGAAGAGLTAIVVEAGGVNLIDKAATVAAADAAGVALWVAGRGALGATDDGDGSG